VNVVFAQLGLDVGPSSFAHTAYQMGITSPLGVKSDGSGAPCKWGPNCYFPPADAIGGLSVGVTPLEQADAYATLAAGGVHHPPTAIARVEFPDGKTDIPSSTDGKRVLSPGEAYEVTKILEGVITKGTGAGYTYMGCSSEAGKTGTSEGDSDAWFVGYTPLYSTAVWTGHPLSRDYTGYGGPTSGPIWRSFMEAAQGSNCPDFEVPSSFPSLSAFYGGHTVSGASQSGYGGSYSYGSTSYGSTTPTYTSTTPTTTTSTSTDQYPPQDYAPGAGQQPLPTPGGGNGNAGGNGNGLGSGGGTGPPSP
jgi:penicillin-binding protein 1A